MMKGQWEAVRGAGVAPWARRPGCGRAGLVCGVLWAAVVGSGCGSSPEAESVRAVAQALPGDGSVCVTVQRGVSGSVADATIWQNAPGWNDAASGALMTGASSAGPRSALLRFDLTPVPAAATVVSASLVLMQSYKSGTSTVNAHRITASWSEAGVTYGNFGQAFDTEVLGSFVAGAGGGARSVELTGLAQSWIDGSVVNHGVLLEEPPVVSSSFRSSEYGTVDVRPRLDVCYVTCSDGVQNGSETGVDCGGSRCDPCGGGSGGAGGDGGGSGSGGGGGSGNGGGGGSGGAGGDGSGGACGSGGAGGSGSGGAGGGGGSPGATGISCGGATYACEIGPGGAPGVFLYVDAAAAPGGTGAVSAPFTTIQQAFLAVGSGQQATVCVAEGTYVEHVGNTADTFAQNRRYTFVGGFASGAAFAVRDCEAHPTILRAPSTAAAAFTFGNVKAFTIDGFSLTGGAHGVFVSGAYSAGRSASVLNSHVYQNGIDGQPGHRGAGLFLAAGAVLVRGNLIEDNHGGRFGGGIFVSSAPSSERNTKDLATQVLTVGPALATLTGNVIRNNTLRHDTPHGAGIAVDMNTVIRGNVVTGNVGYATPGGGDGSGSGIYVGNQYVTGLIEQNWVAGNTGLHGGAGIFVDEAAITTLINNVVVHNVADPGRGAITVDGRAGGSGAEDRGYSTLVNNTIVGNTGGGVTVMDSTVHMYNNLLADNGPDDVTLLAGGSISQSLTADANRFDRLPSQPGVILGSGNVVSAPGFVDAAGDDYHLVPGSALSDLGRATFPPAFDFNGALSAAPAIDHEGNGRPSGAGYDLGAYEAAP